MQLDRRDQQALLEAACADPQAFATFYRRFERPVLGFFMRATGRAELAADLTAETFARALESVASYDPARGRADQWLFGIARNTLRSSRREGRVESAARERLGLPPLVLDDHATETIARLAEHDDRATVAVARLPEEQRHAIHAHVVEDRDYAEIAGELRCSEAVVRQRVSRGLRTLRTRLAALALVCVLATTTIALAATGLILTGAPVHPEGRLNPSAGEGIPAAGASQLLTLRVPDPEGGLPWGMRIVRTTRGEVCEQIGRVQGGRLGELGIDGVFHDDGRFHPIPTDVLPETSRVGRRSPEDDATETVSCQLAGQVTVGEHVGVDRSAGAANGHERAQPRSDLRDLSFGLLGVNAVSVSYREGSGVHTEPVLAPLGAYLIVRRTAPHQQAGVGYASLGTEGDLPPSAPLIAITYRLDGKLCQRGPALAPGVRGHLAKPCARPRYPASPHTPPRDLHEPLHVRLHVSHNRLTRVELSFTAPLAVTSAQEKYEIRVPGVMCSEGALHERTNRATDGEVIGGPFEGFSGTSLDRDVARGATVTQSLSGATLFSGLCGRLPFTKHWTRRSVTIDVLYQRGEGEAAPILVASTTVREPPGIRAAR
jgi:RNA polymerase sigma factor (sigma-70 family)